MITDRRSLSRSLAAATMLIATGVAGQDATIANLERAAVGERVYVALAKDDTLAIVDPAEKRVIAKVPVGDEPHNVAVTPDGRWIFVTNYGEDTVSVIDGKTLKPDRKIMVGRAPTRAGVTPDCRFILVNTEKANQTAVIDVAQMQVVHTIPNQPGAHGIAIDPAGKWALIVNHAENDATLIAIPSWNVLGSVPAGEGPFGAAVTADGNKVYIAASNENVLSVIDPHTPARVRAAAVPVGNKPLMPATNPKKPRAYVGNAGSVSVIDTSTQQVTKTIQVGGRPIGTGVSPTGRWLYVADNSSGELLVIDTDQGEVVARISLGSSIMGLFGPGPIGLAVGQAPPAGL